MASVTTSEFSNLLKTVYSDQIVETLNQETIILDVLTNTKGGMVKQGSGAAKSKRFVGNELHMPLHSGRNGGVGARAEDVDTPTATKQSHILAKFNLAYLYATIELTGQVIAASRGDEAAFAEALDLEMEGALTDARKDVNRQVWGDGSGVLTSCAVTTASQTVNVNSTKFLFPGMLVDVRGRTDQAAVTNGTAIEVATVPTATTFTITSTAITTATTDAVYRAGVRQTGDDTFYEMWGLFAHVQGSGSDTYFSSNHGITTTADRVGQIDRATEDAWRCGDLNNSGTDRNLSFALMHSAFDEVEIAIGKRPTFAVTNQGGRNAVANLFETNRRYVNQVRLKGGYTGVEFNDIGIFADSDCHRPLDPARLNRIYFLNPQGFALYTQEEWGWIDGDNGALHKVSGRDKFQGTLRAYKQLALENPKMQCVLDDVDDAGTDF